MSNNIPIPEGWTESKPLPQEPNIEWVSIEKLLDEHTIPVLAEAVEKFDLLTHDDAGRRILATNGDVSDIKSKAFALAHLKRRKAMLQNPEPDDQLFYDRLEIEGSPLDLFGWPKNQLPEFAKIQPHCRPNNDSEWWTKRSSAEFEKEFISVGKNLSKAAKLHEVSRQRYTEIIKSKCRSNLFE